MLFDQNNGVTTCSEGNNRAVRVGFVSSDLTDIIVRIPTFQQETVALNMNVPLYQCFYSNHAGKNMACSADFMQRGNNVATQKKANVW